ncbi:uncharacterized protein LOC112573563 isoform X3 [Pomacea canaliculata]|uniref:uncharacterized protein LOC112573563 isoform X3 n=1 Tax=Pomacea canaliculata TaxID=400727 RepID=UPI000D73E5F3|nr:uncharacterized protein LOC112573563 isoform X3 [Pomacea canaliculata]
MGRKIQCIGRYAMEGHTLGKGNFARVELAHHTVTGCKVAIKIIDRSKLKDDYQKDHIHREARILGQLRHPNIIRLYETLKATTLHCLVLEYASGGDLQTYIRMHREGRLGEDKARPFVRQLVSALHYLHERGVAHRDLKMENIMLDEKRKHVKVVDFGLSVTFSKDELMKTHCGSPEYAAPELFANREKYGPEIDVWSLGIVMYAMLVGHLPFTTPYTDHYRRQKLVQQMEKGLTEVHSREMTHLSVDLQELMRKVIEPRPESRITLIGMEAHSWVTSSGKLPFFPFQAFPRDKTLRSQDSELSTDEEETVHELSSKLEVKKEIVEQKVGESKSDEISAMYNMMLDVKRRQQGLYDMDHTAKAMERRPDGRAKRRAKSAQTRGTVDKKEKSKTTKGVVPPALVLPPPEVSIDAAPRTGGEGGSSGEPETRLTSFDFLALCSTPTWLGPERRRSRRRSRSPNPIPQHNQTGDYMERHGIEASHAVAGTADQHQGSIHGPHHPIHHNSLHHPHHNHHHHHHNLHSIHSNHAPTSAGMNSNFLSPENNASNLSVPDADGYNPRLQRGSSLKLSRRRARSCGPNHKPKSGYQRTGSVDTPNGSDAPDAGGPKLLCAKSDMLAPSSSPTAIAAAAASLAAAFGGHAGSNMLMLPVPGLAFCKPPIPVTRPANLTLKECYTDHGETSRISSAPDPFGPPPLEGAPPPFESAVAEGKQGPVTSVEVHMAASPLPPPPPNVRNTRVNGIAHPASSAAGSSGLLQVPTIQLPGGARLEVPTTHLAIDSWSTESLFGDSDVTPSAEEHVAVTGKAAAASTLRPSDLLDCSQRPVFHQQVPPHPLSLPMPLLGPRDATLANKLVSARREEGPLPMQLNHSALDHLFAGHHPSLNNPLSDSERATEREMKEGRRVDEKECVGLEESLAAMSVQGLEGAAAISGHFHEVDVDYHEAEVIVDEDDDDGAVTGDSDVDHVTDYYPIGPSRRGAAAVHESPARRNDLPSPDEMEEDALLAATTPTPALAQVSQREDAGSAGSGSGSRGSGRSQRRTSGYGGTSGGKTKTPTTPLPWMVLRSPLARIESFHSDDFEYYNSEDSVRGEQSSASPLSATTPTVPCFAYKLHLLRSKPHKVKKRETENVAAKTAKRSLIMDGGKNETFRRFDPTVTDPLLSSGSDVEQTDEAGDKTAMISKGKVHPLSADDKDYDNVIIKADTKAIMYNNVITKQPKQLQNSVPKAGRPLLSLNVDSKKKSSSKSSPWKRSFAQFLKRKRQSPRCNNGNNNNNDCATSPMLPANHNGCSPTSPVSKEVNNVQATLTSIGVITSGDLPGERTADVNCKGRGRLPTENNVADYPAPGSSPVPPGSPDMGVGGRVFDFTLLTASPKGKSCLLSWGTCGDCGVNDLSSEEDSECNQGRDPKMTIDLMPLDLKSDAESRRNCIMSHQCT